MDDAWTRFCCSNPVTRASSNAVMRGDGRPHPSSGTCALAGNISYSFECRRDHDCPAVGPDICRLGQRVIEPLLEARKGALGKVPPNHSLLACRNDRRMQQGGRQSKTPAVAARLDAPLSAQAKLSRNRHPTATTPSAPHPVSSAWNEDSLPLPGPSHARGHGFRNPGVGPDHRVAHRNRKLPISALFKSARYLAASAFDVSSDWNPPGRTSA